MKTADHTPRRIREEAKKTLSYFNIFFVIGIKLLVGIGAYGYEVYPQGQRLVV